MLRAISSRDVQRITRGQETAVSIYVVRRDGSREPFVAGLPNPTSMAVDPAGDLLVSSRFDGSVHKVATPTDPSRRLRRILALPAESPSGRTRVLYVGDRSDRSFASRTSARRSSPPSPERCRLPPRLRS